jgi:hypothetical protein
MAHYEEIGVNYKVVVHAADVRVAWLNVLLLKPDFESESSS